MAAIGAGLSARDVWAFFRRWQRLLPSPLTGEDLVRGYHYQLALRQLELSDTRLFAPPAAARACFERVLIDQLTLGRPDHVAVVFARKVIATTRGQFSTRGIRRGQVGLQVDYKHSKLKQYLKEGCALRTETTVNDTYRLRHRPTAHAGRLGRARRDRPQVNERLLDAQFQACACAQMGCSASAPSVVRIGRTVR